MPAEPAPDNCWLCSKPLEPWPEPTERVCPHCAALNKPHQSPGTTPEAAPGTDEQCRLCLQPLDTSPQNHRRVCANCGEVNRPAPAPPAPQALDLAELEAIDRRQRRLYGWTLGLAPGVAAALVTLPSIFVVTRHRSDDWVVGAVASFIYLAIASSCALLWKLLRASVGRRDVTAGAGSGFGVSVVGTAALIGLVIVLKSLLR